MKSLCTVLLLLVFVACVASAVPYGSVRMVESVTLSPTPSCKGAATFVMHCADWFANAQAILGRSTSTYLAQYLMVGVQPAPSLDISCTAYQLPLSAYQALWLSGTATLAGTTIHEKDPFIRFDSTLEIEIPLAPQGAFAHEIDNSITFRWGGFSGSIETTVVPIPFDSSAEAYATLQLFSTAFSHSDSEFRVRGSAYAATSIVPLEWGYRLVTLSVGIGRSVGSLTITFAPNAPTSVGVSLSHPLDVL